MKLELESDLARVQSSVAALLLNRDFDILWHNAQAAQLFDMTEMARQPAGRWLPDFSNALACPCQSHEGDGPQILEGRSSSGQPLRLEIECSPVCSDDSEFMLVLLRDAEGSRRMDEEMRMLAHAVMQTGDAVMITSAFGIIQFVNPAFEEITGYAAAEAIGRTPSLLASGMHSQAFFADVWKTMRRGEVYRGVFTNRRKNGHVYHEEKTITPIRDAGGEITHYVSTGRDVTARVLADARLEYLANYDVLTNLPNRSLFMERLGTAIRRCQQGGDGLALLFVDLDRFKAINDTLGHNAGDRVLEKVADRLCSVVRIENSVARLGGDEFTVVLEGLRSREDSARIAEAIIAAFARPFDLDGRMLYLGVSIGIAYYPGDGDDIETLVKHADIAMFHAKAGGRSAYVHFSAVMEGHLLEDLSMETALRSALDNGEFSVVYQPIVDPGSKQTVALEALLRWHSPQHGDVPPTRFIPMLEESGLIVRVGRWVLETACADVRALDRAGHPELLIAVNLSGRQFRDGRLVDDVHRVLEASGLAAARLELEITESILIDDVSGATQTLDALSALGVRLAIDDFGTGYSSLSYLRRFPINTLKIDRSFVFEMESSPDAVAIVRAIVNLAHSLGLEVVGEGVETAGQLALLAELGCGRVQGYWFSRPQPPGRLVLD